jgi:hypothetical protein
MDKSVYFRDVRHMDKKHNNYISIWDNAYGANYTATSMRIDANNGKSNYNLTL